MVAASAVFFLAVVLVSPEVLVRCQMFMGSGGDYFKKQDFINPGKPGPWVKPTKGEIWPKPKVIKRAGTNFSVVVPDEFIFRVRETT